MIRKEQYLNRNPGTLANLQGRCAKGDTRSRKNHRSLGSVPSYPRASALLPPKTQPVKALPEYCVSCTPRHYGLNASANQSSSLVVRRLFDSCSAPNKIRAPNGFAQPHHYWPARPVASSTLTDPWHSPCYSIQLVHYFTLEYGMLCLLFHGL
jgi:hypothetical protein